MQAVIDLDGKICCLVCVRFFYECIKCSGSWQKIESCYLGAWDRKKKSRHIFKKNLSESLYCPKCTNGLSTAWFKKKKNTRDDLWTEMDTCVLKSEQRIYVFSPLRRFSLGLAEEMRSPISPISCFSCNRVCPRSLELKRTTEDGMGWTSQSHILCQVF